MEKIDIHDLTELRELNDVYERLVMSLNESIKEEAEIKIVILGDLYKIKDLKDSLSFDNKLIKLFSIGKEAQDLVKEYLQVESDIKQKNNQIRQIQEKINSLKKIIDVTPR